MNVVKGGTLMTFREHILKVLGQDSFDAEGHIIFKGGEQIDALQQAFDSAPPATRAEVSWFEKELDRLADQVRTKIAKHPCSKERQKRFLNIARIALNGRRRLQG